MGHHKHPQLISLLVPFRADDAHRTAVWNFLKAYWMYHLPDAEIVMGRDPLSVSGDLPFSKSVAVNDAFAHSKGDVIVVVDADAFVPAHVITECAARIRATRHNDVALWFIPYSHIFRITQEETAEILESNPRHFHMECPPDPDDIEDSTGSAFGHRYGALIQIYPREGFEAVGCWDPRFRGWGGEDVSFLRAMDTLFSVHKGIPGCVDHLWHPKFHMPEPGKITVERQYVPRPWNTRAWPGQTRANQNDWLAIKYRDASGDPVAMRELVDEGCKRDPVPPVPPTPVPTPPERPPSLLTIIFRWVGRMASRAWHWLIG